MAKHTDTEMTVMQEYVPYPLSSLEMEALQWATQGSTGVRQEAEEEGGWG